MCGIAGFVDPKGRAADPQQLLTALTQCMVRRGPDGSGTWWDDRGRAGMAHRRLSIIDLSDAGRQPMRSADGNWTLCYNGEVFNFRELRSELESAGVRFRSHTDSEVVLEACAHWGARTAIERFVGMFAFALWDAREQRMWAVRDRLGVKPLVFQHIGGDRPWFACASELGALRLMGQGAWDIQPSAVRSVLNGMCVPAPATIWACARKLMPGQLARFDARSGELHMEQWWSVERAAQHGIVHPFTGSDDDAIAQLDERILEYTRMRLVADVPLGAFLSGGIDSSVVVSAMRRAHSGRVRTYSIGFIGAQHEADDAAAAAKHLGTEHTSYLVDADEALQTAEALPQMFDEPFADSSQVPTAIVSRMARGSVTVALTGDGGDEAFGGYYRHFMALKLWRQCAALPGPVRRAAAASINMASPNAWERVGSALNPLLPASYRQHHFGSRIHKLGALLRSEGTENLYDALVEGPPTALAGERVGTDALARRSPHVHLPDARMQFMLADQLSYLPDDVLTKVDRCSMGVSLEVRTPLLDHRLVEFAWTLPIHMKMRDGRGKWILRKVLARHVPERLWDRPKSGFGAPIQHWLRGGLRTWAEGLLLDSAAAKDGWLNGAALKRQWADFQRGAVVDFNGLWSALMLESWFRRHASSQAATPRAVPAPL